MLSGAISRRGYMVGFKNSGKEVDIDKKYVMATFPRENIPSIREIKFMYETKSNTMLNQNEYRDYTEAQYF